MDIWPLLCLVILVFLSAFFSGAETSFSELSKTKLKALAQEGKKGAKLALSLAEDSDSLMSTLFIGNTLVNISAATVATVMFTDFIGEDYGVVTSVAVAAVIILLFGEIAPKTVAANDPEKNASRAAPAVKLLHTLFFPVNFLFSLWKKLIKLIFKAEESQSITEEELITIIDEAQEVGSLDEQESELIRSAIEFNDAAVESIFTPRVDIVAISKDADIDEIAEIFRSEHFSRLPVYDDTLDTIVGLLHEKDFNAMLYEKKSDITPILRSAVYVPEKMKISKLLRTFQQSKMHMAIVVDEFGGTSGIVTLEDVIESIVGEIWDEHDEVVEEFRKTGENVYTVSCGAQFSELAENLGFDDEENESTTVGGWVQKELDRVPEEGDSFTYKNLFVEVTKTDHHRAMEVRITMSEISAEDTEDDA